MVLGPALLVVVVLGSKFGRDFLDPILPLVSVYVVELQRPDIVAPHASIINHYKVLGRWVTLPIESSFLEPRGRLSRRIIFDENI